VRIEAIETMECHEYSVVGRPILREIVGSDFLRRLGRNVVLAAHPFFD